MGAKIAQGQLDETPLTLDELKRLFARRDGPCRALLGDEFEQTADLRSRLDAELVATEERLRRLGDAGGADGFVEIVGPEVGERGQRPRLGGAPETVYRARRIVLRPLGAEQGSRQPLDLVRDRIALDVLPERDDEEIPRRIDDVHRSEPFE